MGSNGESAGSSIFRPPIFRPPVFRRIRELLDAAGCRYEVIAHRAVSSAEEAAEVRGTALESGAKCLLFKYGAEFGLFAMAADRRLHSAKVRRALRVRRTRFATADELERLTGLQPGSVPPFGRPVLPLPLFADPSLLEGDELVFTAGSRRRSIRLATADWRRLANPTVVEMARGVR